MAIWLRRRIGSGFTGLSLVLMGFGFLHRITLPGDTSRFDSLLRSGSDEASLL